MTSEEIDALLDMGDPAASYERLQAALQTAPENEDEIRTQICRSLGLQRRFDEGREELAKIPADCAPIVKVRIGLESGRLQNSAGDKDAAKPYFLGALQDAERHGFDFYAVDAAHMLGIATSSEESLEWNEKAIEMAAASSDSRAQRWQGSLLNNLGWTYHDMGRLDDALTKFEAALEFRVANGSDVPIRIARWTVARCLRSMKRFDEALAIQSELMQQPEQGYVSEEMGEILLATGRIADSKPHFKRAYDMLSKDIWLTANEPERLDRLKRLSE